MRGYQGGVGLGRDGMGRDEDEDEDEDGGGNVDEIKNRNNTHYKFSRKTSKFINSYLQPIKMYKSQTKEVNYWKNISISLII